MKKPLQLVAMFVIVALVAAAACYVSARLFRAPHRATVDGHEWIHKQLYLTQRELKALEPIETKFPARQRNLMGAIRTPNQELAVAIKRGQRDSSLASTAVVQIHDAPIK